MNILHDFTPEPSVDPRVQCHRCGQWDVDVPQCDGCGRWFCCVELLPSPGAVQPFLECPRCLAETVRLAAGCQLCGAELNGDSEREAGLCAVHQLPLAEQLRLSIEERAKSA